ncbi:hypothetical protein [Deminuibacter soli]|uniref:hypothetical protein n=1 Tax=Deminuibacter soli TaxID=2291815 RepID=UPI001314976E|nr:hypothetical protein [Deminuibacter soli]
MHTKDVTIKTTNRQTSVSRARVRAAVASVYADKPAVKTRQTIPAAVIVAKKATKKAS